MRSKTVSAECQDPPSFQTPWEQHIGFSNIGWGGGGGGIITIIDWCRSLRLGSNYRNFKKLKDCRWARFPIVLLKDSS